MEVKNGMMYPHQNLLDDVQIDTSIYDMIKVDMVHKNTKNMKLEVPPNDMTLTLRDAITRRVQWRRTSTDVDPSAIATTSTTTTQLHTALGSIFPETQTD
jgi:hypothetical protein